MFGRVDCESEQEIAQRFHITKYPTLKMWRNAQVKHHCYNHFYDCMLLYARCSSLTVHGLYLRDPGLRPGWVNVLPWASLHFGV